MPWAIVGVALFVLLFYVYASSLQYAELTLVTLGWIVLLQVGVCLLDRFRYGQAFGPGQVGRPIVARSSRPQTYLLASTPHLGSRIELTPVASAQGRT